MKKNDKRLIRRTVIKFFVSGISFYSAKIVSAAPLLTNELALGQMNNSNIEFLFFNKLTDIKFFASSIFNIIGLVILGNIAYDVFTYIKNKKGENK